MKHIKTIVYTASLIGVGFCAYTAMCYSRIAHMNLSVNPSCQECFSPANTHAGCAIFNNKKIFLVRDRKSKKWGFPAGKHDTGERAFQTAYRETLEETGFRVVIDEYLAEFAKQNFRLFKCNVIEDTGKRDNEILEFRYFNKEELGKIIKDKKDARFVNQLEFIYNNFDKLTK